jgi:hypothetical protein
MFTFVFTAFGAMTFADELEAAGVDERWQNRRGSFFQDAYDLNKLREVFG